jgi:hypothetical protein
MLEGYCFRLGFRFITHMIDYVLVICLGVKQQAPRACCHDMDQRPSEQERGHGMLG